MHFLHELCQILIFYLSLYYYTIYHIRKQFIFIFESNVSARELNANIGFDERDISKTISILIFLNLMWVTEYHCRFQKTFN